MKLTEQVFSSIESSLHESFAWCLYGIPRASSRKRQSTATLRILWTTYRPKPSGIVSLPCASFPKHWDCIYAVLLVLITYNLVLQLRNNIPCHMKAISCGKPCLKPLSCGQHKCPQICHEVCIVFHRQCYHSPGCDSSDPLSQVLGPLAIGPFNTEVSTFSFLLLTKYLSEKVQKGS